MYLKRRIDSFFLEWKLSPDHKPLLVRGARQVGKTKSIREFGKSFKYFVEINFEELPSIGTLFMGDLTPSEIIANISAITGKDIIPHQTLLFFDEIQNCPQAIASLRFFREKLPELHLIAAGSLLEFTLAELPTFGVGRVRSVFMHPLSFSEFLFALGEDKLEAALQTAIPGKALPEVLHNKLLDLVKKFILVGGMPESVSEYVVSRNIAKCQAVLNDLLISFQTDFAKYKKRLPSLIIQDVFASVIAQSGQKFKYAKTESNASFQQVKGALSLLITSGLAIPVVHTAANGLPLGAEADARKQKILLLDTGLFQRVMNLSLQEYVLADDFALINRGSLAEQFVGLEFIKAHSFLEQPQLYYWHREARNSNAEVDYLLTANNAIYPVEVKAGTRGAMKSLYIFMEEKRSERAIRISSENFASLERVSICPLYYSGYLHEALSKELFF